MVKSPVNDTVGATAQFWHQLNWKLLTRLCRNLVASDSRVGNLRWFFVWAWFLGLFRKISKRWGLRSRRL